MLNYLFQDSTLSYPQFQKQTDTHTSTLFCVLFGYFYLVIFFFFLYSFVLVDTFEQVEENITQSELALPMPGTAKEKSTKYNYIPLMLLSGTTGYDLPIQEELTDEFIYTASFFTPFIKEQAPNRTGNDQR